MDKLVKKLKRKVKGLKNSKRKDYAVVERSMSFQKQIQSRDARNLIDRTLAIADKPVKDPLMLWLTGGPGCSGMVYQVGPFQFDYAAYNGSLPSLIHNPYALTQVASVLFLDAPAGTGFSYSNDYQFLQKWLSDHPNFSKNSLYIAGDSYNGKIIPILVQEIHKGREAGYEPKINLHGYIIGNPVTSDR